MVKVYHSNFFDKIIERLDPSRLGDKVGIKVHFGERYCTTYLHPGRAKKVYDWVVAQGKEAALIECNVLYVSDRTRASTHKKLAKDHGFDFAPIHILDGEMGDKFVELNGCKIGKGIEDYDSLIVLTHFKGHLVGFGGAAKNLGMGLGSRSGKMDMHSSVHPMIDDKKCTGCGICAENCPANAINIKNNVANINPGKCIGCAMCISVCPQKSVQVPWRSKSKRELQKRIRDYAQSIINKIGKDKITFISTLENITAECDCMAKAQEPVMEDKGFLVSNDMDAIDLASLELTNDMAGQVETNDQNKPVEYGIVELD